MGGVELCNGFGELTDAREQRLRLTRDQTTRRQAGLPVYPIDEKFLSALEEGLPACSGNALGFDRLVMILTGARCVQDVIAIPAVRLYRRESSYSTYRSRRRAWCPAREREPQPVASDGSIWR